LFLPPDDKGDEVLHFISDSRRIKLKGHSFREFQRDLLPLLNGALTLAEIQEEVADLFAPKDVEACLLLLIENNLLEDAGTSVLSPEEQKRLAPQLNFLHEATGEAQETQQKMKEKTVAILGLGGPGATAAISLASAGIGAIIGIDNEKTTPADPYLSSVFAPGDEGTGRTEVVRNKLAELSPATTYIAYDGPLNTDEDIQKALGQADFIICALDAGQSSIVYKLNRVCLAGKKDWLVCQAAGVEVSVGPLIVPEETACFLCLKMRVVACAEIPEDEFAFQRYFDRHKQDDSATRENLVFGTNLAGQLAALETIKYFTDSLERTTLGRVAVVDLLDLTITKHMVLRKPWCPACQVQIETSTGGIDERTAAAVADR
jgi:adenylyltransferase/sulfurtransferase